MALIQRLLHNLKPMRSSLGLEITDRYVKLAEVVLSPEQKPKLRQYAIEELPPNTVVDGKIIQDLVVIALLRKMFQDHLFRSKQVHMVLPSQLIMVRFLKLPDIPLKDLKKVVEFEMKHNIHLPFDNPFYDFVKLNGTAESVQPTKQLSSKALKQAEMARIEAAVADTQEPSNVLFGEFDKQGTASHSNELTNQCDVMLVASPKELIDDYTTIVEAAGLTPRTIEFKAMSLYRLVSSTGIVSDNQTVLIADINEISSDLSIFHGTQLKITRNVPLAFGYSPSKEIQAPSGGHSLFSEFSEPVNQEEEFFKNACGDLAHELERLMNFYRYTLGNRDHEFATIVISGDIDRISEIVDYCRERLSLNVQVLFSLLIDTDFDDVHNLIPRIAVPLGLGLRGSER